MSHIKLKRRRVPLSRMQMHPQYHLGSICIRRQSHPPGHRGSERFALELGGSQRLVETAPALASRNPTLEQGVMARTSLQLQDETGGVVGTRLARGKAAAGRVGKEGRVVTLLGLTSWLPG